MDHMMTSGFTPVPRLKHEKPGEFCPTGQELTGRNTRIQRRSHGHGYLHLAELTGETIARMKAL